MENQKYNYIVSGAIGDFHKITFGLYDNEFQLEELYRFEKDADPEALWLFMPFHLLNSELKILW